MNNQLNNLNLRTKIALFREITSEEARLEYIPELLEDILYVEDGFVEYCPESNDYKFFTCDGHYFLKIIFDDYGDLEEFSIKNF
ncbi:hypothetical protein AB6F65_07735 [Providencia hangzhouensis]|uniref:hypothetical protein n=1 Tax=Providencia hangzhouensis TaxID=3031799 RepID=UPI0034DD8359